MLVDCDEKRDNRTPANNGTKEEAAVRLQLDAEASNAIQEIDGRRRTSIMLKSHGIHIHVPPKITHQHLIPLAQGFRL
jgi:hypothetical protein